MCIRDSKKHESNRSANYSYNFKLQSKTIRVCKKMFCDTFLISVTFFTIVKKKTTSSGLVEEDFRGKHNNQRKINEEVIQGIFDHINLFTRIECHYYRANTHREYTDGDLNLSEMYRLYKIQCIEKKKSVSYTHLDVYKRQVCIQ